MPFPGYDPSRTEGTLEPTLPDPFRALLRLPSFFSFFNFFSNITVPNTPFAVTDALSTMLRLLGEESEEASWLI
ncbi:uncharacterized protein K441DRAFT_653425 [Cenococcum geophilum 1.58]|uniref:uncharacterized protein n=1 Tax=Cenococcum geophilum 1.58 TaxID=794803 RepID=UPI00358F3DF6|nr:hypothetical protein K441DRAFT_653425 [Cenococcum geophilum 1.58]